jgi:hypothetical protein
MKVVAISTEEATQERFDQARAQGFVTFVYRHADPLEAIEVDKFLRVSSDQELAEKIELLEADAISYDQVRSL